MIKSSRPDPFFIADDVALDLLNSVAAPWGQHIEWISNGQDLIYWLQQSGLVPESVALDLRQYTATEELDAVVLKVRELREWFRTFVAAHAGSAIDSSVQPDTSLLNILLARDQSYVQIEMNTSKGEEALPQLQRHRRWLGPESVLVPIAESIGNFICNGQFERVKKCQGINCTLWFYDISKNHTRRWCTMTVCGNRAKAAAHRAKKKKL